VCGAVDFLAPSALVVHRICVTNVINASALSSVCCFRGCGLSVLRSREPRWGYYRGNPLESRSNMENFSEITAVITGMGTALTGMPR